ncbi:glycosyltransferase family 1 protein [Acetivibrio cellulolyticus]|uniref:glycosyltransferase family 1 protein n=1 Tax=Acetivibrio cellulolyticus TaxID=35830 RepID=UPI0001E2C701|nr:glycosyltransferase family 1 protein [Acetivibrio cellulolyticus]
MLKVLVIVPTIFGYDGISNVATNYYIYQDHKEIKMDVVSINPVNEKFKKELDKSGGRNFVIEYRNRKPISYVKKLRRIIKDNGYQIVHVHGCSCTMFVEMLAAKLAGVKVRIPHSHNTTCDHVKVDKLLRPFFMKLYTNGFACGQEAGEWLFSGKPFDVISNGIDLEKFGYNSEVREQFRKKYDLENKFVIGHVGRFSEQKNHKKLISVFDAVSKVRSDAKLVLIGAGELRDEIEAEVRNKKLDVLFVGLSDEVECWLQAMDVMVFPSLFEGLPLGIVEAQAAGLPCILSNTISPMTAITDLVKFVELEADDAKWAETVINSVDGLDRSGRKGYVEQQIKDAHFDIKTNCRELLQKYKKILEETK